MSRRYAGLAGLRQFSVLKPGIREKSLSSVAKIQSLDFAWPAFLFASMYRISRSAMTDNMRWRVDKHIRVNQIFHFLR